MESFFALFFFALLSFNIYSCRGAFFLGQIPVPELFGLPELSGEFTQEEAVAKCEESPLCAGFTYRGLIEPAEKLIRMKYQVAFLNFIKDDYLSDSEKSNWVIYKSDKKFAAYKGTFLGAATKNKTLEVADLNYVEENWDEICNRETCAGIVFDGKDGKITQILKNVDLTLTKRNFLPDEDILTLINMKAKSNRLKTPKLNTCCPTQEELLKRFKGPYKPPIVNPVPRISCNISRADFVWNYAMKRKVVILEGCIDNWKAKSWTFDSLLGQNLDLTWPAVVRIGYKGLRFTHPYYKGPSKSESPYELFSGRELLALKAQNATVKVIDRIANVPRRGRMEKSSDKSHIFEAFSQPKPLPKCLAKSTFGGNSNEWVLLGTKYTGTYAHSDPYLTDAWNALVAGSKYWVFFIRDYDPSMWRLRCDSRCSKTPNDEVEEAFALPWYVHVLPQLRSKFNLGLMEAVQKPGDLVYIPGGLGHTVFNLEDDTVCLTEHFMSPLNAAQELPTARATGKNPFYWETEHPTERLWKNLMHHRLIPAKWRMLAREHLKQSLDHISDSSFDDIGEEEEGF